MQRILIDSTIWISWLRSRTDPRSLIHPYLLHNSIFTCGVITAEVLRGITSLQQREKMESFFGLLSDVPLLSSVWQSVATLAWNLDRKGKVLPLTDLIIAQAALICGATIISTDRHFSEISGILVRDKFPA